MFLVFIHNTLYLYIVNNREVWPQMLPFGYMKNFEGKIKEYLEERGWENIRPGDVAKSIMIEGAELLENFQWSNPTSEEVLASEEKVIAVRKELADVMMYCFDMAVVLGFDVEQMLNEKLDKVKEKYPAHLFKDKDRYAPGSQDIYWKIKKDYRKEGKN